MIAKSSRSTSSVTRRHLFRWLFCFTIHRQKKTSGPKHSNFFYELWMIHAGELRFLFEDFGDTHTLVRCEYQQRSALLSEFEAVSSLWIGSNEVCSSYELHNKNFTLDSLQTTIVFFYLKTVERARTSFALSLNFLFLCLDFAQSFPN